MEHYNIIVCGAGSAGFCAAVAAARMGMKTALVEKYSFAKEIRGEGLILGVALDESMPVGNIIAAARAEKLMVLSAKGNVLRLVPPLNVSAAECDEALAKLGKAFEAAAK